MSVIKSIRRRRYTSVSNDLGENENLSFTARGLALYLLCKPENWEIQISDLQKKSAIKKSALRSAMVELEKLGYLVFCREFGGRGNMRSFWQMCEEPAPESERSQSWLNKAVRAELSSPPNTRDVFSSDEFAGDLVNTHEVSTQELKTHSLGEVSPRTPLRVAPLLSDSGQEQETGEGLPDLSTETDSLSCAGNADLHAAPTLPFSPELPAIASERPARTPAPRSGKKMQGRPVSSQNPTGPSSAGRRKTADPRASHPAIVAVRECLRRYPDKLIWDEVIAALGDAPDVERLQLCRREQIKRGINPQSLMFVFELYVNKSNERSTGNAGKSNYATPLW